MSKKLKKDKKTQAAIERKDFKEGFVFSYPSGINAVITEILSKNEAVVYVFKEEKTYVVAYRRDHWGKIFVQQPSFYGSFASIVFPIVRSVFAPLVAQNIVSVQPMTLPTGSKFYLDFVHGNKPHK